MNNNQYIQTQQQQRTAPQYDSYVIPFASMRKVVEYAIIVFIMYLTSGTSDFANSKELMIGGWVIFTGIYFYLENYIKPQLIMLLGIFLGISILYYVLNDAYNHVTYLGFFIKILLAYYCRELCRERFFGYFINVVYFLTCVSLFMYTLQLINFDLMYDLNNFFGTERGYTVKSNSVIFTMVPIHVVRNCGFMWEPGAFVSVLLITLYINVFYIKEPLKSRKNLIFLVAIMTTQSTMGIMALLIPMALLLRDFILKNGYYQKLAVIIIPSVLIIGGIVFTRVDFLYKKMVAEITSLDEEFAEIAKAERDDYVVSLTRTASVIVDWRVISKYPLFGLGVDMRTVGFSKLGVSEKLETACGSTILMIRFGLIGFFIYTILLYRNAFFTRTSEKIGWVLVINYILFTQEFSASAFFHLFVF